MALLGRSHQEEDRFAELEGLLNIVHLFSLRVIDTAALESNAGANCHVLHLDSYNMELACGKKFLNVWEGFHCMGKENGLWVLAMSPELFAQEVLSSSEGSHHLSFKDHAYQILGL